MSAIAVGHCLHCAAVVNVHWPSCLVCHALLSPSVEPRSNASVAPPRPQGGDGTEVSGPIPPIRPGWLVVYRNQWGALCGGPDDRAHGMVQECRREGAGWTVLLTDGQRLPLNSVRAVGQTNAEGKLIAAWTVKEHGFDGALKT